MEGCLFAPLMDLVEGKNERAFNDMDHSDQDIKISFLYTSANCIRVYREAHTLSLIDFIDWLSVK